MTGEQGSTTTIGSACLGVPPGPRIPSATYRLQMNGSFRFEDARRLIPYLYDLGISDIYLSPIMQPRAGSENGYDICDHNRLNPELGNEQDLENLRQELSERNMGLIMDLVPNHMGIFDTANIWWTDVLENGPSSRYAHYFDIDWDPVKKELQDKVLLPILDDQYGKALENGNFRLTFEKGSFFIYCGSLKLPMAPRTYSRILSDRVEALTETLSSEDNSLQELQSIITALGYLPAREEKEPEKIEERTREKEVIKRRIAELYASDSRIRRAIDATVREYNGVPGNPESFDKLDALINAQAYRPAFWRVAAEEINYRRFFDINDLAAIRMEDPEVFEDAHGLVFDLLSTGIVNGLRVDHADGLWNPADYLYRLQHEYIRRIAGEDVAAEFAAKNDTSRQALHRQSDSDASVSGERAWPLYVVVEKILSEGEPLPQKWPVYGTTGYDFLNVTNGLFINGGRQAACNETYFDFIGGRIDYPSLVNQAKKMIMQDSLAGEIYSLSHRLNEIIEKNRRYRDFTLNALTFAIREVIASLRVYRAYIAKPDRSTPRDRDYITAATLDASKRNPRTSATLFEFIRSTLLLENLDDFPEGEQRQMTEWVMRFQQITGSVMAKGVEDTAFYIFNRLVSLNEVGGDPVRFGISTGYFHNHNMERARTWPHSLLASTTHDTKRSEDVRARINVLSEIPGEWAERLRRWREWNAPFKADADEEKAPDANDEFLLYQTLVGAWPAEVCGGKTELFPKILPRFTRRMVRYMQKAIKEAKIHTSWVNPNEAYETAVEKFVTAVLDGNRRDSFWEDFLLFQDRVGFFGFLNSLSQLLLKLSCPGIPDVYQGSELWDLRLVDPDNREVVDFAARIDRLREIEAQCRASAGDFSGEQPLKKLVASILGNRRDGNIKLFILYRTLRFRRENSLLFTYGDYVPVHAEGSKSEHICSFRRSSGKEDAVVAVPRLCVDLTDGDACLPLGEDVWKDTRLLLPDRFAGHRYRNVFTDEVCTVGDNGTGTGLPVREVISRFPVALLESVVED